MKSLIKRISIQILIFRYLRASDKFLRLHRKVIKATDKLYAELPEDLRPEIVDYLPLIEQSFIMSTMN